MITIGILSDTHLYGITTAYKQQVERCFAKADMILHAGDLTALEVLDVFGAKEVHAVHGNMCTAPAYQGLPESKVIEVGAFRIGLCHGAGKYENIEARLWNHFGEVDCIVYGHTHRPVCHQNGHMLFVNPGSFTGTGPHGAPGTYAILEINDMLSGRIYQVGSGA